MLNIVKHCFWRKKTKIAPFTLNPRAPVQVIRRSGAPVLSLLSFRDGFIASQGDGSCFIVQQDLDYVIELTGADYDAVYKVATWEKQIYTCCRDGLVRRYQLSDLWFLGKRCPSEWKRLTLVNSEQKPRRSFPGTMSWAPCASHRKSAAVAVWNCHSVTRLTELRKKLTCTHCICPTSPCINSPHNTDHGLLVVWSQTSCVKRLQRPED